MITEYIIEVWHPIKRKYNVAWRGNSLEMAERLFNKPYYEINTRRLIKMTSDLLYKEKGKNNVKHKR